MELKYIEGCTNYNLLIDDKDSSKFKLEELQEIMTKLVNQCDDIGTIQNMILDYVEQFGDVENLGYCDQCNDTTYEYTLDID